MLENTFQFPEIDLQGMKIWLSGAVPESQSTEPNIEDKVESWIGSDLEHSILGFVHEFSSLVFKFGGEIIHGCHPTFTPILLEQARRFHGKDGGRKRLHLAASDFFRSSLGESDWERWRLVADVDITEATGVDDNHRDPSLAILREFMAGNCNAFVAIGGLWWNAVPGRAGIPKEFELAKSKSVPCFILGGFGGASRTYTNENPDWHQFLNNGLTSEQNKQIAESTNFVLVAGRLIAQLALLNQNG